MQIFVDTQSCEVYVMGFERRRMGMIEKFKLHSREIADEFLASMVANGDRFDAADFHASDKIDHPDVREYFLKRARQLLRH